MTALEESSEEVLCWQALRSPSQKVAASASLSQAGRLV